MPPYSCIVTRWSFSHLSLLQTCFLVQNGYKQPLKLKFSHTLPDLSFLEDLDLKLNPISRLK